MTLASAIPDSVNATARHAFVAVGQHEIHVTEWGDRTKPALVMWHGLARTGRDFDELAAALSEDWFVLCPDTIGRGLSTWGTDADYGVSALARIAEGLLDAYGIDRAGWIGTSMGGLIGMWIAAGDRTAPLSWLIINDIGPEVPQDAIDRILTYSATPPRFHRLSELEAALRTVYAPFGPASDIFWRRMAMTSFRRLPEGGLTTHFDPEIVALLTTHRAELTVWDRWERVGCPVHVTAGRSSDILPRGIAERMSKTGPKPHVTWWEDCGHAPTFSRARDIEIVRGIVARLESASQQGAAR